MRTNFRIVKNGITVALVGSLLISNSATSAWAGTIARPKAGARTPTGGVALATVGQVVQQTLLSGISKSNLSLSLSGQIRPLRNVNTAMEIGIESKDAAIHIVPVDPKVLAFLERARQAGLGGASLAPDQQAAPDNHSGFVSDVDGMSPREDERVASFQQPSTERDLEILTQVKKALKSFKVADIQHMPLEALDGIARRVWEKTGFPGTKSSPALAERPEVRSSDPEPALVTLSSPADEKKIPESRSSLLSVPRPPAKTTGHQPRQDAVIDRAFINPTETKISPEKSVHGGAVSKWGGISDGAQKVVAKTLEYYLGTGTWFIPGKVRIRQFLGQKLKYFDPKEMERLDDKPLLDARLLRRYWQQRSFLKAYQGFWAGWNPHPRLVTRTVYEALGGNRHPIFSTIGVFAYSGIFLHGLNPMLWPMVAFWALFGMFGSIGFVIMLNLILYLGFSLPIVASKVLELLRGLLTTRSETHQSFFSPPLRHPLS